MPPFASGFPVSSRSSRSLNQRLPSYNIPAYLVYHSPGTVYRAHYSVSNRNRYCLHTIAHTQTYPDDVSDTLPGSICPHCYCWCLLAPGQSSFRGRFQYRQPVATQRQQFRDLWADYPTPGVDIPIFLGGEVRGGIKSIRRASNYVWWGTAICFIAYICGTFGIMVIVPRALSGNDSASIFAIQAVFGPATGNIADIVLIFSHLSIAIAYILMFSRILMITAQDRHLPIVLTRINRHGVPVLSIITQSIIVVVVALLSFVIMPSLFGSIIRPQDLAFDIYNILQAGTSAIWSFATAVLFLFVLILIKRRDAQFKVSAKQCAFLIGLTFVGIAASLVGIWATISSSWLPALIPNDRWALLVCSVIILTLAIGWVSSEIPRMYALLSEQKQVNHREIALREELQNAYNEQQVLVAQQQELLAEVDRLYREQALAAVTDAITSFPNHRAIMSKLDEELSLCQRGNHICSVLFIDIDHFKQVNDTWVIVPAI